jgi:type VI secretion system protein ImpM
MRCGLFGKLPAKRDFIALFAPRAFLDVWEPWMQGSISASRAILDDAWQQAFLTAPIWRFWLGADICETTVAGAFMSSLDGVGRYYPLTIFACGESGAAIPPPDLEAQDEWYEAAENFLLSTLEKGIVYKTITGSLDQLAPPASGGSEGLPQGMMQLKDGVVVAPAAGHSFLDVCGSLRAANHAGAYAAASFWWTAGGGDYPPLALSCRGMADPLLFAKMLTGRFDANPTKLAKQE